MDTLLLGVQYFVNTLGVICFFSSIYVAGEKKHGGLVFFVFIAFFTISFLTAYFVLHKGA